MLLTVSEGQKTPLYDNYLHVIDLDKTVPEIPLSEVFESITPIVLEAKRGSLINLGIIDIVVTPEYIIVRDYLRSLFLFKRDGTFVHNFGGISGFTYFCYDNTTSTVYTLSGRVMPNDVCTVNMYNIRTGKLLKTIQLKGNNIDNPKIYCNNGELYVGLCDATRENPNGHFTLHKINQKTGEIGEVWFNFEIDVYHDPFIFSDEKSFKSFPRFGNGILSIEKGTGKITPFLYFTPKYTFTPEDYTGTSETEGIKATSNVTFGNGIDWDKISNTNKVYSVGKYFEHKDLVFMDNVSWGKTRKQILYDKKTKDFKYVSDFDDLFYKRERGDGDPKYNIGDANAQDDNGLFMLQGTQSAQSAAYALKQLLEKDLISDKFKSAAIKLSNIEEGSNYVILYYKFKK